ncbi:MAG: hypothetical protein JNL32_12860 [Candidatus Kapabacteria bacterium]|nr:hypothetical protein [Candidatus Kapabacteria bacterium]
MFTVGAQPRNRRSHGLADPPSPSGIAEGNYYSEYDPSTNQTSTWILQGGQWQLRMRTPGRGREGVYDPTSNGGVFGSGGARLGGVVTPGGSSGTTGSTGTIGGAVTAKKDAPCPCRWEQVKTVKYLTDEPKPGSVPVMVQTSKWVCDQPSNVETKVLCEETNVALGGGGANKALTPGDSSNLVAAEVQGLFGLGQSLDPNIDYSGTVNVGNKATNTDEGMPWWAWALIGTAVGGGVAYVASN